MHPFLTIRSFMKVLETDTCAWVWLYECDIMIWQNGCHNLCKHDWYMIWQNCSHSICIYEWHTNVRDMTKLQSQYLYLWVTYERTWYDKTTVEIFEYGGLLSHRSIHTHIYKTCICTCSQICIWCETHTHEWLSCVYTYISNNFYTKLHFCMERDAASWLLERTTIKRQTDRQTDR